MFSDQKAKEKRIKTYLSKVLNALIFILNTDIFLGHLELNNLIVSI